DLLARWITNELVALDLRLPAGNLAYTEDTGAVILDAGATIATAGATSLAGGSLRVEFDQDALTEDRLAVRNVGDAIGEIGVLGNFIFNPPIGQVLPAGSDQLLLATFVPADSANFTVATITNLIEVEKAPLVITADNKRKIYGQPNPPLTASYSGFVNGDTAADLDTALSLSTTATASSPEGSYEIISSGAYDVIYRNDVVTGLL